MQGLSIGRGYNVENFSPGIFQGLLAGKGRSPLPTFSPFRTGKHWPGLSEVLQTAPTQKTGGRRTCFLRGIQKTRGRPPAGSIKGAALRILTSITQRQQGQRASATPVQIEKQAV